MELLDKQKFLFGSIFLLANKLQIMGDHHLSDEGITLKQWFLIAMTSQFRHAPTLSEVSELMGSSRQNVKQLALKLQEKGFVKLEKDPKDHRIIRLVLTDKNQTFWTERQDKDDQYIRKLFESIPEDEINGMFSGFHKLVTQVNRLSEGDKE